MMKSSALFQYGPQSPMSTSHTPNIVSHDEYFQALFFCCSSASMYYREHKLKSNKWGRPGNMAMCQHY